MKRLIPILLVALCGVAHAAPSLRYTPTVGTYASSVSTLTVSTTNDPQAGDTVCAAITWKDTTTPSIASVSDGTNSYTNEITSTAFSTNGNAAIWCFPNITTQSGTYTITVTSANTFDLIGTVTILDIQGVATASIDQSGQAAANATSLSPTAGSANTTTTDFEIAAFAVPSNAGSATSVPSGGTGSWTAVENSYAGTGNNAFTVAWKVASVTETTTATASWTTTQFSGSVVLSLKASGGGSCTHSGMNSAGAIATPNGTTGSYRGPTGAFVTPNCSSVNYIQSQGAIGSS